MDQHVDFSVLSNLREVMESEYAALLHIFIKDSETRVSDLNQMVGDPEFSTESAEQLKQMAMIAHSFKGSSANLGAFGLAQRCAELEDLLRGDQLTGEAQLRHAVSAIEEEFRVVRDIFDVELHATLMPH